MLIVFMALINFSRMKVPMTPTIIEPDDVEGWRNEESPEAPK